MAQMCTTLCEIVCNCASPLAHAELCTNSVLSACLCYTCADESNLLETHFWLAWKVISVTTLKLKSICRYAVTQQFCFVPHAKGMHSCVAGMPDWLCIKHEYERFARCNTHLLNEQHIAPEPDMYTAVRVKRALRDFVLLSAALSTQLQHYP